MVCQAHIEWHVRTSHGGPKSPRHGFTPPYVRLSASTAAQSLVPTKLDYRIAPFLSKEAIWSSQRIEKAVWVFHLRRAWPFVGEATQSVQADAIDRTVAYYALISCADGSVGPSRGLRMARSAAPRTAVVGLSTPMSDRQLRGSGQGLQGPDASYRPASGRVQATHGMRQASEFRLRGPVHRGRHKAQQPPGSAIPPIEPVPQLERPLHRRRARLRSHGSGPEPLLHGQSQLFRQPPSFRAGPAGVICRLSATRGWFSD